MNKRHLVTDGRNALSGTYIVKASEDMRRNIQIRPGQPIPPKPQGRPVGVPQAQSGSDKK